MPAKSRGGKISQRGLKYLAERGIEADKAAIRFGLFTAHDHDGAKSTSDDSANYLGIPYMRGVEEVYVQFRDMRPNVDHKWRYMAPTGSTPAIFNVDAIDDPGLDGKALTICEGAFDAIATMETGAQRVIGIPGAENVGLIKSAAEKGEFDEVDQIILGGHADNAGRLMNEKLAAILTPSRCKVISFPGEENDLNDVLLHMGKDAVLECLRSAEWLKVKGVYRPSQAPRRPPLNVLKVSAYGADFFQHIGICKRQLSIWTGLPNDGKSAMLKGLLWGLISEHGVKPAVAFYEEDFHEHTVRDMSALRLNSAITDPVEFSPGIFSDTFKHLLQWMDEHWVLIEEVEDEVCTVDQFIEQAKAAIVQEDADFLLADPWSQFDVAHPQFSETEMTRRYIIELRNLAKEFNVHVALVAHPKKHNEYGGTQKLADGNDVAGSLHFNGRCDLGVTVARDPIAENVALVSVWKVRRKEMGKRGLFALLYDEVSGRYSPMTREELAFARGEDPAEVIDFNKAKRRRASGARTEQRRKDIYE